MRSLNTLELQVRCLITVTALAFWDVQAEPTNLVPDASFESHLPAWFIADSKQYHIAKHTTASASHGQHVMIIKGWANEAAEILSPFVSTPKFNVSVVCNVRHRGPPGQVSLELLLLNPDGGTIATIGEWVGDGNNQWRALERRGVEIGDEVAGLVDAIGGEEAAKLDLASSATGADLGADAGAGQFRFQVCLRVTGPHRGHEIEIDQLGIFDGADPGEVSDNAESSVRNADAFVANEAWEVKQHDAIYKDGPPGAILISKQAGATSATATIQKGGKYRIWARFRGRRTLQTHRHFKLAIASGGAAELQGVKYDSRDRIDWRWGYLDADLPPGEVPLRIEAAKANVRISNVFLTNNRDYVPRDNDLFTTPLYLRFVNRSAEQAPFLLYTYVKTHSRADPHQHIGMYAMSGAVGPFPPDDRSLFIHHGDSTPWLRISDVLFADRWTHENSLQITATRVHRLSGHLDGRLQGELQFATTHGGKPFRSVTIDQRSPFLTVTLPYDVGRHPEAVMLPEDYVKRQHAFLKNFQKYEGPKLKHLQVIMDNPSFDRDARPIVLGELQVLHAVGANSVRRLPRTQNAIRFYSEQGMLNRYTLDTHSIWSTVLQENSMYHPDTEAIDKVFSRLHDKYAATKQHASRVILADEPGGMTHQALSASWKCREAFQAYMKSHDIRSSLELEFDELVEAAAKWELFDPEKEEGRKYRQPKLFYHMEIFRLKAMAHFATELTTAKNRYFPATALSAVNHVPYHSYYISWAKRGVDPYFVHQPGALELPWTEDWVAAGAGTQEMSPQYALLRSVARHRGSPLGGYIVVKDRGGPELVRMKLYTALAGGMRVIDLYNYSPPYAGWLNSWSESYDRYPYIARTLEEFAAIDGVLHGAVRHTSPIAILYNRTQAIWANHPDTAQYDAELVHWALAHAGYDADFVSEEDVCNGGLAGYKVLYFAGEHLRQDCATAISNWVESGGVVCGTVGAGQRNEYHEPQPLISKLFGASAQGGNDTGLRLPRSGMKKMVPNGHFLALPAAPEPEIEFPNFSYIEQLTPDAATPVLATREGQVVGTTNRYGGGRAIRFAGALGINYLCSAVRDPDYDPESFLPKAFNRSLRDLIVWPAKQAGITAVSESAEPIMEIVRYQKPTSIVLLIIDHDAVPKSNVRLQVPEAGRAVRVWTATGAEAKLEHDGDAAIVTLALDSCDAVVLELAK